MDPCSALDAEATNTWNVYDNASQEDIALLCSSSDLRFSVSEMQTVIRRLKNKKSTGFDLVSNKMIKALPSSFASTLVEGYNRLFSAAHWCQAWKQARTVCLNKANHPAPATTQLRTISLLPVFSKLYERLSIYLSIYLSSIFYLSIYIYKEECLSVCLFAMHSHTIRPNAMKLSTEALYNQGKVDVYFFFGKTEACRCYRQSMKLTNRIAAMQKSKARDSEGGRRPSERSSATIHMIRVPVAMLCLLPTEPTNRIAAFQKETKTSSEGGRRPSERSSARDRMRRVPAVMRSLLHATYMTDQ